MVFGCFFGAPPLPDENDDEAPAVIDDDAPTVIDDDMPAVFADDAAIVLDAAPTVMDDDDALEVVVDVIELDDGVPTVDDDNEDEIVAALVAFGVGATHQMLALVRCGEQERSKKEYLFVVIDGAFIFVKSIFTQ